MWCCPSYHTFRRAGTAACLLRKRNDSQSVIGMFNLLYLGLRTAVFMELFPCLLTDASSDFFKFFCVRIGYTGNRRTTMYYRNIDATYQKRSHKSNHKMIQRIIPKGADLGQYLQEQIELMISHVNYYSRLFSHMQECSLYRNNHSVLHFLCTYLFLY